MRENHVGVDESIVDEFEPSAPFILGIGIHPFDKPMPTAYGNMIG